MTECACCGDCCVEFPLNTPERADLFGKRILAEAGRSPAHQYTGRYRKMAAWMANLEVVSGPFRSKADDKDEVVLRWRYRCPLFNEETRLCGDHANRPQVCRRYPWYGKEPDTGSDLSPRCSFNADVRKMLPIVEVT